MTEYNWADPNGNIVKADYNPERDVLKDDEALNKLKSALEHGGRTVACVQDTAYTELYKVTVDNNGNSQTYLVLLKGCTPGGRDYLNEQRIQPYIKNKDFSFHQQAAGNSVIWLGVYQYQRTGPMIFCSWKPKISHSKPGSKSTSGEELNIDTVAAAMRDGFVRQLRNGTYVCAFREEFIHFYLNNHKSVHDGAEIRLHQGVVGFTSRLKDKYNLIIAGAPGTGKSYQLEQERLLHFDDDHYERVTFHPSYSYAQFVGTYKPAKEGDPPEITYKYVPGPFIRVLMKAIEKPGEPHLLLIEEINRANAPGVFGDVFQLLDRKNGESEFPVIASEDLQHFLQEKCPEADKRYGGKIAIPPNMYIWASMNSADQGVFPIDTAFRRRWDYEFIGINAGSEAIEHAKIQVTKSGHTVNWNELREVINEQLLKQPIHLHEDKLIGPFFIDYDLLSDPVKCTEAFKSKVLMYLFEDAVRHRPKDLFKLEDDTILTYSKVCDEFDKRGDGIFGLKLPQEPPATEPNSPVNGGQTNDAASATTQNNQSSDALPSEA